MLRLGLILHCGLACWLLAACIPAPAWSPSPTPAATRTAPVLTALPAALTGGSAPPAATRQAAAPAVAPSDPPTGTPQPAKERLTLGYYTGSQASFDAVQAYSVYLKIVSADVFIVQMDGSIAGRDDFGAVAYGKAHGIHTYLCVNNYNIAPQVDDFDAGLAHAAIVTHKEKVIEELASLAVEGGYEGVNVDLENLAYSEDIAEDRAAFSAFIHDLAGRLHTAGLKLAISVPGKTADTPDNPWTYPFDLAALGQDADYLQLMTYDQNGPWGPPGPVSGVDWVEACVAYAASQAPPEKLLIGLPAYGYDWDLTASDPANETYSAVSFDWTDVPALLARPGAAAQWDPVSQSPSVTYTQGGHEHVAWYENPQSIRAKTALVVQYDLAGLSMWALGSEDEQFWQAALQGMLQR